MSDINRKYYSKEWINSIINKDIVLEVIGIIKFIIDFNLINILSVDDTSIN